MDGGRVLIYGQEIQNRMQEEMQRYASGKHITMAVIQAGDNEASGVYIRSIRKYAAATGIDVEYRSFSENVAEEHIVKHITDLNHDDEVTGIMIQMPLPKHLNAGRLINAMDYRKDVEGIHNYNLGKLIGGEQGVAPSTPKAVMFLLRENKVPVAGRKVVIIGRSVIVGTPLAILMSRENATVTLCHSHTRNLAYETRAADILVTAAGKPGLITPDMVTEDTVVIDAGINVDASGRICGDVHEETCSRARLVSAVPGGVGVITVATLFDNLRILHKID